MGKLGRCSTKRIRINKPDRERKAIRSSAMISSRLDGKLTNINNMISTSNSFLADESNDSGLGDLSLSSLYESSFNLFENEEAVDSDISMFPESKVHSGAGTVFSLKSVSKNIKRDSDDLNLEQSCIDHESTTCLHKILNNAHQKNDMKRKVSCELVGKKRKKMSVVDQPFNGKEHSVIGTGSADLFENDAQENTPVKRKYSNTSADSLHLNKVKTKRSVLCGNFSNVSKNGAVKLEIINQPERQHRARYLTEGSRGAVKDQSGHCYPEVKLSGYNKKVKLQVFVGTDVGKVQPHLFYQASKVCGKHSTPCNETKIDGTVLLEIEMDHQQEMVVSCDCVGILKERNVDVEKRLALCGGSYSKKKCTKCRLIFRVLIPNSNLSSGYETLQVASSPISCTQPPGIPEISKKSLSECCVEGNVELFIIGKNFLKDTEVIFEDIESVDNKNSREKWKVKVLPDKDYIQHNHLICEVPPYRNQTIRNPTNINLLVVSGGQLAEESNSEIVTATENMIGDAASKLSLDDISKKTEFSNESPVRNEDISLKQTLNEGDNHIKNDGVLYTNAKELHELATPKVGVPSSQPSSMLKLSSVPSLKNIISPSSISSEPVQDNLTFQIKPVTPSASDVSPQRILNTNLVPVMSNNFSRIGDNNLSNVLIQKSQPVSTTQVRLNLVQPTQFVQARSIPAVVLSGQPTLFIQPSSAIHKSTNQLGQQVITKVIPTHVSVPATGAEPESNVRPTSINKILTVPVTTLVDSTDNTLKNGDIKLDFLKNISNVGQVPAQNIGASKPNISSLSLTGFKNQSSVMETGVTNQLVSTVQGVDVTSNICPSSDGNKQPFGLPAEGYIGDEFQTPVAAKEVTKLVKKPAQKVDATSQQKPESQAKPKDYFNQHVNLMTEFSELPDADLISLINPSTFDNV